MPCLDACGLAPFFAQRTLSFCPRLPCVRKHLALSSHGARNITVAMRLARSIYRFSYLRANASSALVARCATSTAGNFCTNRRHPIKTHSANTYYSGSTVIPDLHQTSRSSPKHVKMISSSLKQSGSIDTMMKRVRQLARVPQTGVSLQELFDYGHQINSNKLILAAKFLHHELAVRYAHRIRNLEDLPHGLNRMPSVQKVREWYLQSIQELLAFPRVETPEQELQFTALIESIKKRHNGTLFTMARGVYELKLEWLNTHKSLTSTNNKAISANQKQNPSRSTEFADLVDIHSFLDAFYMSRIGIRMLMGQHIALHEEEEGWVGCICETTSPAEIALGAIDTARNMCIRQYGDAPDVEVHGHTDFSMPYVPSHLHHMLFEVIKVICSMQEFYLMTYQTSVEFYARCGRVSRSG